jgi:hypothetical protein
MLKIAVHARNPLSFGKMIGGISIVNLDGVAQTLTVYQRNLTNTLLPKKVIL